MGRRADEDTCLQACAGGSGGRAEISPGAGYQVELGLQLVIVAGSGAPGKEEAAVGLADALKAWRSCFDGELRRGAGDFPQRVRHGNGITPGVIQSKIAERQDSCGRTMDKSSFGQIGSVLAP